MIEVTRTVRFVVDDPAKYAELAGTTLDWVARGVEEDVDRELGWHVMCGMADPMRRLGVTIEVEQCRIPVDIDPVQRLNDGYHVNVYPMISNQDEFYFALIARAYAAVAKSGSPIRVLAMATGRSEPTVKSHVNIARDRGYLSRARPGIAEGELTDAGRVILAGS